MTQSMLSVVCALVVAISGLSQPADAADQKVKTPGSVGGIDAPGGGTITGVVFFQGEKPQMKPVTDIAGSAFCKQCYKDGDLPLKDTFVFGKNGDHDVLQNVLIYVSKGLEGKAFDPPKQPVVLDQIGCVYTPHVVAVMAGQTLEIRNSDATLHNVMTAPENNPGFNVGMPVKDQKLEKIFTKPEFKMNFKCFMHPWMSGYVHVMENPFFAVTREGGTFTLKGLPPGEYELSALHESSRFEPTPATIQVKVEADKAQEIKFVYQPAKPE